MALPKLNSIPKYELTVPSSGKTVKFRPYLVKEEKVMMLAFESGDLKQTLHCILETIASCVEDNLDVNELTTFDIEYMFIKIRSKSVGEKSTVVSKCSSCQAGNEIVIDLGSIEMDRPADKKLIAITDTIQVEMRYPSYVSISQKDLSNAENNSELGFELLTDCLEAVLTEEERIVLKDEPKEEITNFVESLTTSQFTKLAEFLDNMPKLSKEVNFTCNKCEHENNLKLEGMSDFF